MNGSYRWPASPNRGMNDRLIARLHELAAEQKTITYGALAAELELRIGVLTDALEDLMQADALAGRPFLAAICAGRLNNGLPARGFFDLAARLGRDIGDPAAFVMAERAALFVRNGQGYGKGDRPVDNKDDR
jgi:hypothetical protein